MSRPLVSAVRRHPVVWITAFAIVLRLLLFLGRGDYVAFDEGWYLLLGRNLWSGSGYALSGLQHVTLSPLFPVLAGALDVLIDNAVWAGRIVTAIAAGLLVVPCWYIFDRMAGRTTALIGSAFVALMPSLAPFVAPYWIGWDLWVGAEPLLHLFLFTGVALFLRAWLEGGWGAALGCGVAFGLAYLARPEAVVTFGLLGLVAIGVAVAGRSLRERALRIGLCAVAFAVVATPYWLYLHDELGRWAISGRAVNLPRPAAPAGTAVATGPTSNPIEDMLWQGQDARYIRTLYSLNASGTALANGYWGVRPVDGPGVQETAMQGGGAAPVGNADVPGGAARSSDIDASVGAAAPMPLADPAASAEGGAGSLDETAPPVAEPAPPPSREGVASGAPTHPLRGLGRYARALGIVVPWYIWLFVAIGLVAPELPDERRRLRLEVLVGVPLVATSLLIAVVVATDPRTQLFLAPLAGFYAARGARVAAKGVQAKMGAEVRPIFATALVAGALALVLLGTSARRLWLSLTVGSPHHIVAAENAAVGAAIREASPPDATVMSWHPAIALFAHRDWRVLPLEPVDRIVRYARTQPNPYMVFSVYYPPELPRADEPHYLIVPVSAETPDAENWRIQVEPGSEILAFGRLSAAVQAEPTTGVP